jgi:hypothetical protein
VSVSPSLLFGESTTYILGDTFLRSAYVVYDLTHNEIGFAQANFGSTTSNIVELKAADSGIPSLTGVASGVTRISTNQFSSAAPTTSASSVLSRTTAVLTRSGSSSTIATSPTSSEAKNGACSTLPNIGTAAIVSAILGLSAILGGFLVVL